MITNHEPAYPENGRLMFSTAPTMKSAPKRWWWWALVACAQSARHLPSTRGTQDSTSFRHGGRKPSRLWGPTLRNPLRLRMGAGETYSSLLPQRMGSFLLQAILIALPCNIKFTDLLAKLNLDKQLESPTTLNAIKKTAI